jgi:hypothetical protein
MPAHEGNARAEIVTQASIMASQWIAKIDRALARGPLRSQDQAALLKAKADVSKVVLPTIQGVVWDATLPLTEVERRVGEFLPAYASQLDGQIAIVNANDATFTASARNFLTALRAVVKKVVEAVRGSVIDPLVEGAPWYVFAGLGLAAIFAVGYTARSLR